MDMNSEKMKLAISSGEENAGGIAALGKSLLLLKRIGFGVIHHAEESLTQRAIEGMKKIEGLRIFGVQETNSAKFGQKIGVIVFDIKNMMGGKIAKKLALNQGIGIRFGCHCAHLIVKQLSGFTPFLERLQKTIIIVFPKLTLQGFARISFGLENTTEEVDVLLIELERIARRGKSSGNININEQASITQVQNKADVKKMMAEFIASWEKKIYSQIN
jgi:selenocysteine lyase/cysteine desulfurase